MSFPADTVNVKLYGAFRSFTNAAAWLLDNFLVSPDGRPVRTWHHSPAGENHLHKHLLPKRGHNVQGYLLCVKHPLTWATSMRKYLRNTGQAEPESRMLASLWSFQSQALLEFAASNSNAVLSRYEVAIKHPKDLVQTCATKFGLEARPQAAWPERRLGRGADDYRHLFETKTMLPVDPLEGTALEQFKTFCDNEVLEQLGYRL